MKAKVTMFGVEIMREDFLQKFYQRMIIMHLKNILNYIKKNLNICHILLMKKFFVKMKKKNFFVKCWN